ncbi:MAG: hypothetical protein K1X57_13520 [Gemmataceae bacterium]|nr:hypothetical protein [Gemmataceae bacterium]
MDYEDDDDNEQVEVPEGAALFPIIPPELHISPPLLAILQAVVFIAGSAENIVHPDAGEEALLGIATYLERLDGSERDRFLADLTALHGFARDHGWPKQLSGFLKDFPKNFGLIDDFEDDDDEE